MSLAYRLPSSRRPLRSRKLPRKLPRRKIVLPEPIKQLGEFTVPVKLEAEVEASLKVSVGAE